MHDPQAGAPDHDREVLQKYAEALRNVGGTSGAESEKNGERIGKSYLVFHGWSYFRDRAVRHLRCLPHSGVFTILTVPVRPYDAL